ncbi:MAG: flagellin [Paracoccaceae bacterium]
MNYISVGDMARQFQLRQHNVQLKQEITRLTEEMMTGTHQDLGKALGGDMTALASIDRQIRRIESFDVVTAEAEVFTSSMQNALGLVQDLAADVGVTLLSAATSSNATLVDATTNDAAVKFASIIGTLNTDVAGRHLFSGASTGTKPLPDAADILSSLQTAIAGETTAAGVLSVVETWFNAAAGGGGYLDVAYAGSSDAIGPFRISESDRLEIPISAASQELRDVLKGFALSALIADGLFANDLVARSDLTRSSGEIILTAQSSLSNMQADLGTREALIEDSKTRNSAETSSLELARNSLVSVDEFDTATAVTALQTQLETLYTLTARMSELSLVDYI